MPRPLLMAAQRNHVIAMPPTMRIANMLGQPATLPHSVCAHPAPHGFASKVKRVIADPPTWL